MNYTSDRSTLAAPTAWQSTTDLTIETWYKPESGGIHTGCCDTLFGRYDFRFFTIFNSTNGNGIYTMISFTATNGSRYYQHPVFYLSSGEYHHLVGARRNNRFIIWIDGVERHNSTFGAGLPLYAVSDSWHISSTTHSDVDIDINRIYNRGLSDSEILQNFNSQKNRFEL